MRLSLSALFFIVGSCVLAAPLSVAFPPDGYATSSATLFLLGAASPGGEVLVDGTPVQRSRLGYFAPVVELQIGPNSIEVRHGDERLVLSVTRLGPQTLPDWGAFALPGSIYPDAPASFQAGETIALRLSALPGALVEASLGEQSVEMRPRLEGDGSADAETARPVVYEGALTLPPLASDGRAMSLGAIGFSITRAGCLYSFASRGEIFLRSPSQFDTVEVVADACAARTGPSLDDARVLTLPKGARASVSGEYGDWYRLDFGFWIQKGDARFVRSGAPLRPRLGDVLAKREGARETIRFYLSEAAPVGVFQDDDGLDIAFYGVETRTELLRLVPDDLLRSVSWSERSPGRPVFRLRAASGRQWGYSLRYEGSVLVLELNGPPPSRGYCVLDPWPLKGISLVLDPGHGGSASGAIGPDGTPEKDLNLAFSLALAQELRRRGAEVSMTRDSDADVSLADRVAFIQARRPTLAISIHHNSLGDSGVPEEVSGMGAFWYNPQAVELAEVLFKRFVAHSGARPYGLFWDNLAIPRATASPTVLLELGFMCNPAEFELLVDPAERARRASALALAVVDWSRLARK